MTSEAERVVNNYIEDLTAIVFFLLARVNEYQVPNDIKNHIMHLQNEIGRHNETGQV